MNKHSKKSSKPSTRNSVFLTLGFLFVLWLAYRTVMRLPDWVDEVFVKACIFGLPAWMLARKAQRGHDILGLSDAKLWNGLFVGLAVGAFYEFLAVITVMLRGTQPLQASILSSPMLWYILFLAFMTAWWESLFFFGYTMNALLERYKQNEWKTLIVTVLVFLVFHAPLRFVLGGFSSAVWGQLLLLALFAIGQALLYLRTRNIYAITVSHALWGLMLMIYT